MAKASEAPTGSKFSSVQKPKVAEARTFQKVKVMTPEEIFAARVKDEVQASADASEAKWRERMYALGELILSKEELKKIEETESSEAILERIKKNLSK